MKAFLAVTVAMSMLLLGAAPVLADSFGSPNFTLYGSHSLIINDSLNASTVCAVGNIGSGGSVSVDKCLVQGNLNALSLANVTIGSNGAISGSEIFQPAWNASSVNSGLITESSNLAALGGSFVGDLTDLKPNGNYTFTPGTYQIGNINLNTDGIVLNGAGTYIFNVSGTISFACSSVQLQNGASSANVILT